LRRILSGALALTTAIGLTILAPVTALACTVHRSAHDQTLYIYWQSNAQSSVYFKDLYAKPRYVWPVIAYPGYSDVLLKLWDDRNQGKAIIGWTVNYSGGSYSADWGYSLYQNDGTQIAGGSGAVIGDRGGTRSLQIHRADGIGATRYDFIYAGTGVGSIALAWPSDFTPNHAAVIAQIHNWASEMWGHSSYRWFVQAATYSSNYGTNVSFAGSASIINPNPTWFYAHSDIPTDYFEVYDYSCY
jgi:hypothetical protein